VRCLTAPLEPTGRIGDFLPPYQESKSCFRFWMRNSLRFVRGILTMGFRFRAKPIVLFGEKSLLGNG
jgi:hypothetical protein